MQIFVVIKNIDKAISLQVEPTNTILMIKEKIEALGKENGGVPTVQQLLTLENGIQLLDPRPLSHFGLQDGSAIILTTLQIPPPRQEDKGPLELGIKLDAQEETKIKIEGDDMIVDVKRKLEQLTGIPLQDQQLLARLDNGMSVAQDCCRFFNKVYLCTAPEVTAASRINTRRRAFKIVDRDYRFYAFLVLFVLNVGVLLYVLLLPEVLCGALDLPHWH